MVQWTELAVLRRIMKTIPDTCMEWFLYTYPQMKQILELWHPVIYTYIKKATDNTNEGKDMRQKTSYSIFIGTQTFLVTLEINIDWSV